MTAIVGITEKEKGHRICFSVKFPGNRDHGLYIAYHCPGVILKGECPLSLVVPPATLSRFYTFGI